MSALDPGAPAVRPSDVRLVSGKLSEPELAAIAVAVSAYSVISRIEAHERELVQRSGTAMSTWNAPQSVLPSGWPRRHQPGPATWRFSHR